MEAPSVCPSNGSFICLLVCLFASPSCCFTSCQTLPLNFFLFVLFPTCFSDQTVKPCQREMNANITTPPAPPLAEAPPPVTPAEQVTDGTISDKKQQRPVYLSTRLPADTSRAATLSQIKLFGNIIMIYYYYCHYYDDFFLFSAFFNSSNSISRLSDTQVLGAAAGGRGNKKVNSWAL